MKERADLLEVPSLSPNVGKKENKDTKKNNQCYSLIRVVPHAIGLIHIKQTMVSALLSLEQ